MIYELKLKTGYFKTMPYNLIINENQIILAPLSTSEKKTTIEDDDLIAVYVTEKKNPEIEIQTGDNVYIGTLNENVDLDKLLSLVRTKLNIKKAIIWKTNV